MKQQGKQMIIAACEGFCTQFSKTGLIG
jgi:hypothetical protein